MSLKFGIIVVSLNPAWRLADTVNSILSQTYDNYEIMIKDGMSTDGSIEALTTDRHIRIIKRTDTGIYDGMNQALEEVSGDYIIFMNCGDFFYDRTTLEQINGFIEKDECKNDIYYGDIYDRSRRTNIAAPPRITNFDCYRNIPCHQACVYSLSIMRKRNFDTTYRVRADYEHFLHCYFAQGVQPKDMKLIVCSYEGGGFSDTKKGMEISAREHEAICRRYFTEEELKKYERFMALSLQPLRKKIADNKNLSKVYQAVRGFILGK